MKLESVAVSLLKPAPYNPRTLTDSHAEALRRSLDEFGLVEPLVWNKQTNHVVGGNQRLMILKESGVDKVDVVVVDLPLAREKLLNLRLNKLSGEWDMDKLSAVLKEIDPADWALTGFDEIEIKPLVFDAPIVEDEIPDPPKKAITQPGDLWTLGEHRVLCGDSTKAEDVDQLLAGRKPFIMVTDPPYGVDYASLVKSRRNQKKGGWQNIEGDNASPGELEALLVGALGCPSAKVAFVWHPAGAMRWVFWSALESHGWSIAQEIVWVKSALVFGRADYHWQHETCMYAKREGAGRQEDRTQTTVWSIDKQSNADHPTQKPVECMARPIRNHGGKDDDVYDPFLGSGTTLIAAEQLGRKCYGLEIEPKYCDVIVERWENLTSGKAKRKR